MLLLVREVAPYPRRDLLACLGVVGAASLWWLWQVRERGLVRRGVRRGVRLRGTARRAQRRGTGWVLRLGEAGEPPAFSAAAP